MLNKRIEFLGLLILVVSLTVTMAGCDMEDPPADQEPVTYTLTLMVEGEGQIYLNDEKVDIENDSKEVDAEEGVHDIKAVPGDNWKFKEWEGDVADTESAETTVTMDSDREVTAVFEKESLTITNIEEIPDKAVEFGTEFEDIDLPEDVEVTLDDNSTTNLDVNWLEGDYDGETAHTYAIVGELELTDDIINPDNLYPTVQVTVQEEDITLYTVSVDYDDGKGTVTGDGDFEEGEEVELTATAKEDYQFVEWTGYVESTDNTITFDMPAEDVELTAVFEEYHSPITEHELILIGENISSTPNPGYIESGIEVTITVMSPEGKQVATFIVNNSNKIEELIAVPANQYIFTITENTTIEVTYEDIPSDGLRTGMHLYGSDGVYLGKLTTNEFHIDSVFNEFGTYGSSYSQTSIWNQYGPYGSPYSDLSAFNDFANNPPEMYYKGSFVGYVTTNIYLPYSLHPLDLYSFLEYNGF